MGGCGVHSALHGGHTAPGAAAATFESGGSTGAPAPRGGGMCCPGLRRHCVRVAAGGRGRRPRALAGVGKVGCPARKKNYPSPADRFLHTGKLHHLDLLFGLMMAYRPELQVGGKLHHRLFQPPDLEVGKLHHLFL